MYYSWRTQTDFAADVIIWPNQAASLSNHSIWKKGFPVARLVWKAFHSISFLTNGSTCSYLDALKCLPNMSFERTLLHWSSWHRLYFVVSKWAMNIGGAFDLPSCYLLLSINSSFILFLWFHPIYLEILECKFSLEQYLSPISENF